MKLVGGGSDINGATPSSFIEYTDISRFYNHCRKFYLKVQCIKIAYKEKTTTETNLSSPFYYELTSCPVHIECKTSPMFYNL